MIETPRKFSSLRIHEDRRRSDLSPEDRAILEQSESRLQRIVEEARTPCDRNGIWNEPGAELTCSLHIEEENYATGLLRHLPPDALAGIDSRTIVFGPLHFDYREGVYDGPLIVLVDRDTASASEYFAAMLRDNDAAWIVGERTAGAGCGYVDGGVPLTLSHCGWTVQMPNCVRYRADGINEIEGIEPDLRIDLSQGDALGILMDHLETREAWGER